MAREKKKLTKKSNDVAENRTLHHLQIRSIYGVYTVGQNPCTVIASRADPAVVSQHLIRLANLEDFKYETVQLYQQKAFREDYVYVVSRTMSRVTDTDTVRKFHKRIRLYGVSRYPNFYMYGSDQPYSFENLWELQSLCDSSPLWYFVGPKMFHWKILVCCDEEITGLKWLCSPY